MFKPLICLLMLICCSLLVSQDALSQMSPEGLKAMREGMARAQKREQDKEANKKESPENRSNNTRAAATRGGRPPKSMGKPNVKANMKKDAGATPSFEPFDVKPKSLMAVLDSDGDGQLSGDEIDFATDQLLRLDVNDNGQIDVDELPGDMAPAEKESMASGFDPAYKLSLIHI